MGFIANDGDVLVDCVITDLGREFLARNDGSFEIARYTFGDDEVNYALYNPNTGSLQQDIGIINTPIFEASVNEKIALKYSLLSISNPDLKFLPSLAANNTSITLDERNDSQVGRTVEFKQTTQSGRVVPSEIVDASFSVEVNNDLLFIEKQTPVSISPYGTAAYMIPRTAIGPNQGSIVNFNVSVQSLSADVWGALGRGTVGSRTITTKLKCEGNLSRIERRSISYN
jgi:hypothetical protein